LGVDILSTNLFFQRIMTLTFDLKLFFEVEIKIDLDVDFSPVKDGYYSSGSRLNNL